MYILVIKVWKDSKNVTMGKITFGMCVLCRSVAISRKDVGVEMPAAEDWREKIPSEMEVALLP